MTLPITDDIMDELERRIKVQQPGHAISYVYTSGTTGNPKGVMLSHDNYVWTSRTFEDPDVNRLKEQKLPIRYVSYLPLSHVAAQFADIFLSLSNGCTVFFADANALKGTLIDYLLDVRPTIFLGVPRIYEKMEEKVRAVLEKKKTIFNWSQHVRHGNELVRKVGNSRTDEERIAFHHVQDLREAGVQQSEGQPWTRPDSDVHFRSCSSAFEDERILLQQQHFHQQHFRNERNFWSDDLLAQASICGL